MKKIITTLIIIYAGTFFIRAAEKIPSIALLPANGETVQITVNGKLHKIKTVTLLTHFFPKLANQLTESNKITSLGRKRIEKDLKENRITRGSWSNKKGIIFIGKILMADYVLTAKVVSGNFTKKNINIKISGKKGLIAHASIKLHIEVININTEEVIFGQDYNDSISSKELAIRNSNRYNKDWTLSEYKNYLMRKISKEAAKDILNQIFPDAITTTGIPENLTKAEYKRGEIHVLPNIKQIKEDKVSIQSSVNKNIIYEKQKIKEDSEPAYPTLD
jgi:hypothetical protein